MSINPCADAILAEVAEPAQILALSNYSRDPASASMEVDVARRFPATSGTVEEVAALSPDVVLAGAHIAPATLAALAKLDIPVVRIGVAGSVEESAADIRRIAAAVGRPDRGEALISRIDAALESAEGPPGAKPVPALVWQGGGLVPGEGTLVDELLTRTGFRNVSASYGLEQWDAMGLERLIADPPVVLLKPDARRGDRMLDHPALADTDAVRADFPQTLLFCGGPTIARAVRRLAEVRRVVRNGAR